MWNKNHYFAELNFYFSFFWKISVNIFYFQSFWKVFNVLFIFTVQIISFQSFSFFFIENLVNFKVFTCIYAVLFTFVHNGAS